MKRSMAFLLLGAALVAAPALLREEQGARANTGTVKVAVLDLERTLYDTTAGKDAEAKFDKVRKKKQGELDKEQKALQKYAAELDKQATVLKEDVLEQKKQELNDKFVALQQLYMKLEKDLAGERAKLVQDLLKQASPFIEELANAEGVDMIVDAQAVVWSNATVDLTDELTAKMK